MYVPSGQDKHTAVPVTALNVPFKHAVHATPLDSAVYPTKHVHDESDSLATGDLVFPGQVEHVVLAVAPRVVEYVPAAHGKHVAVSLAPRVAEYVPR